MFDKGYNHLIKMDISDKPNVPAYPILHYDYYVPDYFLAKSLHHVLKYTDDEILFEVALDEASKTFKVPKDEIVKHVKLIKKE